MGRGKKNRKRQKMAKAPAKVTKSKKPVQAEVVCFRLFYQVQ